MNGRYNSIGLMYIGPTQIFLILPVVDSFFQSVPRLNVLLLKNSPYLARHICDSVFRPTKNVM